MAFKDVFKKLNLSGTGAKLTALRQKLPFGKKPAEVSPELTFESPIVVDDGPTDPGIPLDNVRAEPQVGLDPQTGLIETPPEQGFFSGVSSKIRESAARAGNVFKKKSTATPDIEPGIDGASEGVVLESQTAPVESTNSSVASSVEPFVAPEGSAFKRYSALAGYHLNNFSQNFRTQAKTLATQIKENFPKNMEDLKKIQPDEIFERMRQLTGGRASGMYLRIGAAAFASYFMADTVSLFTDAMIPDAPPVPAPIVRKSLDDKHRSVNEYAAITDRNIFSAKNIIPRDDDNGGIAQKTNLPLTLIGTVVLKNETKSIATIEDKSQNMVFPVRIGDTMNDRIEIKKIEHLKVTFINRSNNRLEFVEIIEDQPTLRIEASHGPGRPSDGGITKLDDTHVQIEQKVIRDGMANLNEVLQQARAIPNFENGMPDGYKILQIVPGSVFDKFGIKNGDIITSLNGEAINDPGKALGLLNDLPNANHVDIGIKRGGRKTNMSYDIK